MKSEKRLAQKQIRSERFRNRLLEFCDDRQECVGFAYNINNLVHGEVILEWLLKRNLKGQNYLAWLAGNFNNSFLASIKFIVKDVNRSASFKPITGKDFYE